MTKPINVAGLAFYEVKSISVNEWHPQRIQRRRAKGWRMPLDAVYVGRPTKWGNPFSFGTDDIGLALQWYREAMSGGWNPKVVPDIYSDEQYHAIYQKRQELVNGFRRWNMTPLDATRVYLRGHNLACWCGVWHNGLRVPCHADVLLELANEGYKTPAREEDVLLEIANA